MHLGMFSATDFATHLFVHPRFSLLEVMGVFIVCLSIWCYAIAIQLVMGVYLSLFRFATVKSSI